MKILTYLVTLVMCIAIFRVKNFVFVDESGLNRQQKRLMARGKRGVKIYDKKRGKREKKVNIVAGLLYGEAGKKYIAVRSYENNTTAVFLEDWFEWELLSIVPENSVIVMDNAPFHRKRKLAQIAARYGVIVVFLPPYAPQFNPIEKAWANFKKWLKYNFERFLVLDFAIEYYFNDRPLLF